MEFLKRPHNKKDKPTSPGLPEGTLDSSRPSNRMGAIGKIDRKAVLEGGSTMLENASKILETIETLGEASEFLAPLKVVCGLINGAIKTAIIVEDNNEDLSELSKDLYGQLEDIAKRAKELADPRFSMYEEDVKGPMDAYTTNLKDLGAKLDKIQSRYEPGKRNYMKRFWNASSDQEELNNCRTKSNNSFQRFTGSLTGFIAKQVMVIQSELEEIRTDDALDQLPYAVSSKKYSTCLEGTRVDIINNINHWATDPAGHPILGLIDQAGTGKSTIAAHMIEKWDKRQMDGSLDRDGGGLLIARFHFSKPTVITGEALATTLARDMASRVPSLRPLILQAINQHKPITSCSLQKQLNELVFKPLKSLSEPYIMVIDALDECCEPDRMTFLRAASEFLTSYTISPPPLRLFLTSRPESDIISWSLEEDSIKLLQQISFSLHDPGSTSNQDDIRLYAETFLKRLAPPQLDRFVARANGLFIWASTTVKVLNDAFDIEEEFENLLTAGAEDSPLDSLYEEILKSALNRVASSKSREKILLKILQAICIAREPLSVSLMDELLGLNKGVSAAVTRSLSSVLSDGSADRPIYILHPTFLEYIRSAPKAGQLVVREEEAQALVAEGCLKSLMLRLKYDICDIKQPNEPAPMNKDVQDLEQRLAHKVTPCLRYAALHGLFHAAGCLDNREALSQLRTFFSTKLLNWIELMSLVNNVYTIILALSYLSTCCKDSMKGLKCIATAEDEQWCDEAVKLIQPFQTEIQKSALQVYFSFLIFLPQNTIISRSYPPLFEQSVPKVLYRSSTSAQSMVLAGHAQIRAVCISRDGNRIISADDWRIRHWDVATGAAIAELKVTGSGRICCLEALPDGRHLAAGCSDHGIVLWDAETGSRVRELSLGKDEPVGIDYDELTEFSLSPIGKHLAVIIWSDIYLWEIATTNTACEKLTGHTRRVSCITFSTNGRYLASGSEDTIVHLWGVHSYKSIGQFRGHSCDVTSVAFSTRGEILASGSCREIYVSNVETGEAINQLRIFELGLTCLSLSNSHEWLAYSGYDCVKLWNIATHEMIDNPFPGQIDDVHRIHFAPDDQWLVLASLSVNIQIWDIPRYRALNEPTPAEEQTAKMTCLEFSENAKCIAFAVEKQYAIHLWDTASAKPIGEPLYGHKEQVKCLAFSPNGQRLASGDKAGKIWLWDVSTELGGTVFVTCTYKVACLAFGPDSEVLASGSTNGTICIWDVKTRNLKSSITSEDLVYQLCFSPDGQRLASVRATIISKYLHLWDVRSGEKIGAPFVLKIQETQQTRPLIRFYTLMDTFFATEGTFIYNLSMGTPTICSTEVPFELFDSSGSPLITLEWFHGIWIHVSTKFTFALPSDVDHSIFRAHRGIIAFGGRNGLEGILDCSHLI